MRLHLTHTHKRTGDKTGEIEGGQKTEEGKKGGNKEGRKGERETKKEIRSGQDSLVMMELQPVVSIYGALLHSKYCITHFTCISSCKPHNTAVRQTPHFIGERIAPRI